jgi:hypothetical protein
MLEKLACKLGRNDEVPNVELAELLCKNEDADGIKEIAEGLKDKDKAVANDCIKVLYEIGTRKPALISGYADDFLTLLHSRNNRLVWGGMTALAVIAELAADTIYNKIELVLSVFKNGSVIAVDNGVTVLAGLCKADKKYETHLFPLLLEHLRTCRTKEVPQHAERAAICVNKDNIKDFFAMLSDRREYLDGSRLERIKKLENKLKKQFSEEDYNAG